jgi:hypothetical protein
VNGIRNRFGGAARAQRADPEFYALIEKMRKVQSAGAIGMRFTKKDKDKEESSVLVWRGRRDPAMESLSAEIRTMLGLDPQANEFQVVSGAVPRNDKEMAILPVVSEISGSCGYRFLRVRGERKPNASAPTATVSLVVHSSSNRLNAYLCYGMHFWIYKDPGSVPLFLLLFTQLRKPEKSPARDDPTN